MSFYKPNYDFYEPDCKCKLENCPHGIRLKFESDKINSNTKYIIARYKGDCDTILELKTFNSEASAHDYYFNFKDRYNLVVSKIIRSFKEND